MAGRSIGFQNSAVIPFSRLFLTATPCEYVLLSSSFSISFSGEFSKMPSPTLTVSREAGSEQDIQDGD